MKRIISLLTLLALALTLVSCGEKEELPDGMQLVRGGEEYGYYFYAPEEWTVSNLGDIAAAYASSVDSTSVSYAETSMPDSVSEYFTESLAEFSTPPTVLNEGGTVTTFGNADDALEYIYEYEYSGHKFRTRQIFVSYGERFGIFTFTAVLENISDPEKNQYDFYKDKLDSVIKNFKFTEKKGEPVKPEYEAKDGYKLVSDKSTARFSLFVPEDYEVEYSSGIVLAKAADGSNVTMTRAMSTGVTITDYWKLRRDELSAIVGDITVISELSECSFGNAKSAAAVEYTYEYNGTVYHVYQVFSVTAFKGFTFTYTATEANYAKHMESVREIIKRVEL